MSGAIRSIRWVDENRSLFKGGMDFYDLSGTGAGPWVPLSAVLGKDGTSLLVVNADGSINTNSSAPPTGAGSIATNQVSVTNGAGGTLIVAARATRKGVLIVNLTGTDTLFIGNTGLTTGNGLPIVAIPGAGAEIDTTAAVFGIIAGGAAQTVGFLETF